MVNSMEYLMMVSTRMEYFYLMIEISTGSCLIIVDHGDLDIVVNGCQWQNHPGVDGLFKSFRSIADRPISDVLNLLQDGRTKVLVD